MLRFLVMFAMALLGYVGSATALSCQYSGTAMIAENTPSAPGECWDLSAWPLADAKAFCPNMPAGADQGGSKQVDRCPLGPVGRCVDVLYQPPFSQGLPEDYYAQLPPDIAAEVRANMAEMNEDMADMKRFAGRKITVYYYPDPHGFVKAVDQRQDCKNKKGRWVE